MFKDIFELKKNSYHSRMMKYIWNLNYYDFSHMCPYWWLSVFNHIIFIPIFLLRQLWKGMGGLVNIVGALLSSVYEMIDEYLTNLEEARYKKEYQYFQQHPDELLALKEKARAKLFEKTKKYIGWGGYRNLDEAYSNLAWTERMAKEEEEERLEREKRKEKFLQICDDLNKIELVQTNKFENYLKEYEEKKRKEAYLAQAERIKRNKQRINKILKIVKPIMTIFAYTVGVILGLVVFYYLVKLVMWIIRALNDVNHSTYVNIGQGALYVGGVIVGLVIAVFLIIGLFKFLKQFNISFRLPKFKFIGKFFRLLASPFVYLWKKIVWPILRWIRGAFFFLIQMIKNECPAIKWVD